MVGETPVEKDSVKDANHVNYQPTTSVVGGDVEELQHSPGHNNLHRDLKARHISMIALGGSIGTGLIIGT